MNLRCVVALRMRELHRGEQNGKPVMIEAAKRLWLRLSDGTELVSIWVVQHEREDSVSQRSDVAGALLRRNVIKLTVSRSTKSPTVGTRTTLISSLNLPHDSLERVASCTMSRDPGILAVTFSN